MTAISMWYYLTNLHTLGEPDQGTFYEQLSAQEIFRIERVLKKKKNQVFVKWKVTVTGSIRGYH